MNASAMPDELFEQFVDNRADSDRKINSLFVLSDIITRQDVISPEQLSELIEDAKRLNVTDAEVIRSFINEIYLCGTPAVWKSLYDADIFPKEHYIAGAIGYKKPNVLRYILETIPNESIDIPLGSDPTVATEINNICSLEQAEKYFPLLSVLIQHPKTKNSIFNQRADILTYLNDEKNSIWLDINDTPYVMANQDAVAVKEEHDRKCKPLRETLDRFTQIFNSLMIEDVLKELGDD